MFYGRRRGGFEDDMFSRPRLVGLAEGVGRNSKPEMISTDTPYPYPPLQPPVDVPPFRVREAIRSLDVNPEPIIMSKTPMQLHRARVLITENEIGHSLNEASQKFFGEKFPLPVMKKRSGLGGLGQRSKNKGLSVRFDLDNEKYKSKTSGILKPTSSKRHTFAMRTQIYPAVVLVKTDPIAPLRLHSPVPQPKLSGKYHPPRLEDLNVVDGFPHINTDGKSVLNTFAPVPPKNKFNSPESGRLGGSTRFRAEIDLNGFLDNEIYFQTDDTSLLVIGLRKRRDGLSARKVTEVLDFPEGIYPESLCISRASNGTLIIEQHF